MLELSINTNVQTKQSRFGSYSSMLFAVIIFTFAQLRLLNTFEWWVATNSKYVMVYARRKSLTIIIGKKLHSIISILFIIFIVILLTEWCSGYEYIYLNECVVLSWFCNMLYFKYSFFCYKLFYLWFWISRYRTNVLKWNCM